MSAPRLRRASPELSADISAADRRKSRRCGGDPRVLTLLEASVAENAATVLHIIQHGIDLEKVHTPADAEEYARRHPSTGLSI